jgi:hypothetical protein
MTDFSLIPVGDDPKPKNAKSTVVAAANPNDVIVTPKGNVITKQQFEASKKNGLEFNNMQEMANWIDGWAHPISNPVENVIKAGGPVVPSQALPLLQTKKPDYFDKNAGGMRYHQ